MHNLRWRYALRDLWLHKTRTLLVILSIAIGVFAFGFISGAAGVLATELSDAYLGIHPASATFHTSFVDDAMVASIDRMPEVTAAEGRHKAVLRYRNPQGEWHDIQIFALDDYENQQINVIHPFAGAWPPPRHAALVERNSLAMTGHQLGGELLLETAGGHERALPIAGLAHDMNQPPAQITGVPYAYVDRDTLEWLGLSPDFNEVHLIVAENAFDKSHITQVALDAQEKLEVSGYAIFWMEVREPGEHFVQDFLPTILLILGFLGTLALVLSGFLVVNVISAILTQQTRQIGVMKAIGARPQQITGLYLRMSLFFGIAALLISVPLGVIGANLFARFIAGQLNFDISGWQMPLPILLLQMLIGLLAPMLAALYPILRSSRMTVREAIQDQGLGDEMGSGDHSSGRLQRIQQRLPLSRPLRLSLRNTFRRRGRLIRTLIPLMLGGAIFMSVLSVRASLFRTLEETILSQGFDVQLRFDDGYRVPRIEEQVAGMDDIAALESWTVREGVPLHADDSEGNSLFVYAVPPDTQLLEPELVAGRWLRPDDGNAIVVSSGLLFDEEGLDVGSEITLKIGDEETDWRVVGINQIFQPAIAPSVVYVSQDYFWELMGDYGRTDTIRVLTRAHDAATHTRVMDELERQLGAANVEVVSTRNATEDRNIFTERFNILTVILMMMAFLLAMVGSLGLLGAMSINVLERKREIGVMRAIGASTQAVLRIFVVEGVVIGLLSWAGGLVLAQPMSRLISRQVGLTFARLPLTYVFDLSAPVAWLLIVVVIAALASLAPAYNAVSLSVRETLEYE